MRTKFVLHGGFTPGEAQVNDSFFKEILSDAPSESVILLVYFAKEADRVVKYRDEDIEQFNKNKGSKTLQFETASEDGFVDQVKKADVVYLHGGHTGKILETLKKYSGLKELFEGKIVAGDSAGANVLAAAFYSGTLGVAEGLGVIPLKVICHYREELKNMLQEVRPELEIIFLLEYQFKVITG